MLLPAHRTQRRKTRRGFCQIGQNPVDFLTKPDQCLTRNSAESSDFNQLLQRHKLPAQNCPNEINVLRTVRKIAQGSAQCAGAWGVLRIEQTAARGQCAPRGTGCPHCGYPCANLRTPRLTQSPLFFVT
jgi:hypothetical protein